VIGHVAGARYPLRAAVWSLNGGPERAFYVDPIPDPGLDWTIQYKDSPAVLRLKDQGDFNVEIPADDPALAKGRNALRLRVSDREGTPVERLFGAWIDNVHDAATRPQSVDGVGCPGFFGDLVSTSARVLRRFATGAPAVTEARIGRGSATLIAFDAARSCWKPGDAAMQDLLAGHLRGETAPRWSCDVPQTVRRRHADADHYFVINDGPARSAVLRVFDGDYATVEDVLGGGSEEFRGAIPVEVPAYDARWLRCARR